MHKKQKQHKKKNHNTNAGIVKNSNENAVKVTDEIAAKNAIDHNVKVESVTVISDPSTENVTINDINNKVEINENIKLVSNDDNKDKNSIEKIVEKPVITKQPTSHKADKAKKQKNPPINNNNTTNNINNGRTTTQNATELHVPRRPTLTLTRRTELDKVVESLLRIGFKQPSNATEEWKQYLETQTLLQRAMELEAPLTRKVFDQLTTEQRISNVEKFYNWMRENNAFCDDIEIAIFPGYDLGLRTKRNFVRGERLFFVPQKLILHEDIVQEQLRLRKFETMSNLKLSYAVMLEYLNPNSFWRPYFDLLPDTYPTVLYYTIEDMEMLRGSNVLSMAIRQCRAIARQYAIIYSGTQHIRANNKNTLPIAKIFREHFCYDIYRWAVSTVMTRENVIPRITPHPKTESRTMAALIPFWDMGNHQHGEVTTFYDLKNQYMESSAMIDFKKGDQIFMHYGNRSNAEFLVHNGFIYPENPTDYISVKFGLNAHDPLIEKRSNILESIGIGRNVELKVLPPPVFVSPQILAFVRVFNMNEDQLKHWSESGRASDLLYNDCSLETELETKTWQYLKVRFELLLRAQQSTIDEDKELLLKHKNGIELMSSTRHMIVEYRLNEKQLLLGALNYFQERTKT